jgi:hypothetical protein
MIAHLTRAGLSFSPRRAARASTDTHPPPSRFLAPVDRTSVRSITMADPTLSDVFNAIARLEKGQAEIRDEMTTTRREMATKVGDLEAKMTKRFDKVDKAFASLDEISIAT